MPIVFECEACAKSYTVPDHLAGKKGQCKQCGAKLVIPLESDSEPYGVEGLAPEAESTPEPAPLLVRTKAPAPPLTSPQGLFLPKAKQKKKKSGSSLQGPGGYNGDHLRHLIWIGIVVAFFLFRGFVKSSIRSDMREAAAQRQAQDEP